MTNNGSDSNVSRRQMLATTGAAVTGSVLLAESANAQPRVTRRLIIPSKESFVDGGYDGYFLHVGERSAGTLEASRVTECEFTSWAPEDVAYYNGSIIDRLDNDARQIPVTIFANSDAAIQSGTLWAINTVESCPNGYVGVNAEQIGSALVPGTVAEEGAQTATGGSEAFGPGFSLLGAAAGVGGLLALLGLRDDE